MNISQIMTDASFAKVFAEAEEFVSPAKASLVDIVTRIDISAPTDRTHIICAVQCPEHLSSSEYGTKFEGFVDRLLELPITQKNVLKHSVVCHYYDT